jgi:hypothetical protein
MSTPRFDEAAAIIINVTGAAKMKANDAQANITNIRA